MTDGVFAKKTFVAMMNPYGTVKRVFPSVIDHAGPSCLYLGLKDTNAIDPEYVRSLERAGIYLHTIDAASLGGRAVDPALINPLTMRPMTGSSSGSALNVLYHINDIALGTDGGGSVLAPAASVNLYGFISPSLNEKRMRTFAKTSTDGITFTPSLGFIARDLAVLKRALALTFSFKSIEYEIVECPADLDRFGARRPLISWLRENVRPGVLLVSHEGPVDLMGTGDSISGSWDESTRLDQRASMKGLMRVANMAGLSALSVPSDRLACCTLLISSPDDEGFSAIMSEAEKLACSFNPVAERYFSNLDNHFSNGGWQCC